MTSDVSQNRRSGTVATALAVVAGGAAENRSVAENGPLTSPTLLGRMQCWEDTAAWKLFVDRYHHLFESWSRKKIQNPADVDEVNQQVYWEVARRLPAFQYDATRSFRGWLRTLHQSRLLDFLKLQKRRLQRESQVQRLRIPVCLAAQKALETRDSESSLEESGLKSRVEFSRAMEIQDAVRARISERTWTVFREIALDGQSIAETAQRHGMKYTAAFAAYSRVCQMLRLEASGRCSSGGTVE